MEHLSHEARFMAKVFYFLCNFHVVVNMQIFTNVFCFFLTNIEQVINAYKRGFPPTITNVYNYNFGNSVYQPYTPSKFDERTSALSAVTLKLRHTVIHSKLSILMQ